MLRSHGILLVALIAAQAASIGARASDVVEVPKLKFGITLTAKPTMSHVQDAVQKTPNFWLMDGTKKIVPSRVGFIYHIERTERNLILLSLRSQGLYGWARRDSVIPYSQAEGYFTNELETRATDLIRPPDAGDRLPRQRSIRQRFPRPQRGASTGPSQCGRADRAVFPLAGKRSDGPGAGGRQQGGAARSALRRRVPGARCLPLSPQGSPGCAVDLDRAAELGSRSVYIPLVRGSIHVERRELEDAIKAFQDAITIDPKSFDAHLMLGSVQLIRARGGRPSRPSAARSSSSPRRGPGTADGRWRT